jgi:hypothetical protein
MKLYYPILLELVDFFFDFIRFFTAKRILVLLVVAFGLAVVRNPINQDSLSMEEVASCGDNCNIPDAVHMNPIHIEEVRDENWQFDLHGDGWKHQDPTLPEIKVALVNSQKDYIVFMVKEETEEAFISYVVNNIRGFAMGGAFAKSIKQLTINGNKFVRIQFDKSGEIIWMWATVKNKFGYSFACGYRANADAGNEQLDFCNEMAESLQIK